MRKIFRTRWLPAFALVIAVTPLLTKIGFTRPYLADARLRDEIMSRLVAVGACRARLTITRRNEAVAFSIEARRPGGDVLHLILSTFVVLTSGTSWPVPADWSVINTVECVGPGGSGGTATAFSNSGGGGGGGGYSKSVNLTGLSGNINILVSGGGSVGNTYFNPAAAAFPSSGQACGAHGGGNASGITHGTGAAAGYAIGTGNITNTGGDGGDGSPGGGAESGGGGGGAGSPTGNGNSGGAGTNTGGGTPVTAGSGGSSPGGGAGAGGSTGAGGTGGSGTNFGDAAHGTGGGGAGGGVDSGGNAFNGGGGGTSGGAGGGGSDGNKGGTGSGGGGANGLIFITYTPLIVVATPIPQYRLPKYEIVGY